MEMTYHCEVKRADRVQHIINDIGLGQIVREKYVHTMEQIRTGQAGKYLCLTDTGIMIVKSEDKLKVITMYIATYSELLGLYGSKNKIPKYLHTRVDRNQIKYIKKGKTIWK